MEKKKKINKNLKVRIVFEVDKNFDKEFSEFIEEVLAWRKKKNEKSKKNPKKKNEI